jgi:predicted nucleic acid-binding protein
MTEQRLLFDANAIYRLIRECPEKAIEMLMEGTTISLAYYELGNALWREAHLLKRISIEEAEKSLSLMYAILVRMQIVEVDGEQGIEILQTAHKCNLTFYDSTYLAEAKKTSKIILTDDNKLAKAAEILGIETLSSNTLTASHWQTKKRSNP